MEMAAFPGGSGAICQQFEGIVYLGLKQRLHDRWRAENLPCCWRRRPARTRKLLSADSFISVDIYQVNYPVPFICLRLVAPPFGSLRTCAVRGGGVVSSGKGLDAC